MTTQTRVPTSNIVGHIAWDAATGTNYQMVDEYPAEYDVNDYNSTAGTYSDQFGFSAFTVPAGATNITVKEYIIAHTLGQTDSIEAVLVVDDYDTEYRGAITTWGAGWAERSYTWTVNPKTSGAWTPSAVNSLLSVGYYHNSSDELVTAWVSRVYLEVSWELTLYPFVCRLS